MAEIKVSQLPEASQINDNDLLMIVQGGENKKITKENCQFASGDEVYVGDTEPTDESIKLWLSDDDALVGEGSYISNTYGTSQAIGYAQEYLNNKTGVELWTNPHPDNEFNAQTININLSSYKYIEIYYTRWQGTTLLYNKIPFEENSTIYSQLTYSDYDSGEVRSWNRILTIDNSGITFNVNQINGTTSNYGLIPYKIIGYK